MSIQPPCGGPITDPASTGCLNPRWSPDGKKIVFTLKVAGIGSIYTANSDGSDFTQITQGNPNTQGDGDDQPDWGPRPCRHP